MKWEGIIKHIDELIEERRELRNDINDRKIERESRLIGSRTSEFEDNEMLCYAIRQEYQLLGIYERLIIMQITELKKERKKYEERSNE